MEKIVRILLIFLWFGTGMYCAVHAAQAVTPERRTVEKNPEYQCLICSQVMPSVDIEDGDDEEEIPCGVALCHGIGKVEVFEGWDAAIAAYKKKPTAYMHFLHVSCIQKILHFKNSCPGCGNHFSGKERCALLSTRSVVASAEALVPESKTQQ